MSRCHLGIINPGVKQITSIVSPLKMTVETLWKDINSCHFFKKCVTMVPKLSLDIEAESCKKYTWRGWCTEVGSGGCKNCIQIRWEPVWPVLLQATPPGTPIPTIAPLFPQQLMVENCSEQTSHRLVNGRIKFNVLVKYYF